MLVTDLPSPNVGGIGLELRRLTAQVISRMQISAANYTGAVGVAGRHPSADELEAFFLAAAAAVTPLKQSAPVTGETGTN